MFPMLVLWVNIVCVEMVVLVVHSDSISMVFYCNITELYFLECVSNKALTEVNLRLFIRIHKPQT